MNSPHNNSILSTGRSMTVESNLITVIILLCCVQKNIIERVYIYLVMASIQL